MRRVAKIFSLLLALAAADARAAPTTAEFLLSADTAPPGETVLAGVQLAMEPGWHTYWKNPGESGQATKIKWQLPSGVTAGEIQWPLPKKLPPAEVTTYGYEEKVVLLVPLTLASNLLPGPLEISADVSWLECKETCIPGSAEVTGKIVVGAELKKSGAAANLEAWLDKVPQTNAFYQFQARWEETTNFETPSFIISNGRGGADKNIKLDAVDFFPDASDDFEIQSATEIISATSADIRLRKTMKKFSGGWPKKISGVVVLQTGDAREGFEVKTPLGGTAPAAKIISTNSPAIIAPASPALPPEPLWRMLIYAFIGGLILNIMPCVLPVIALKILGFVSESKSSPRRVRALGGIYAIGVLFSFLVLAALVIGVKAAGHQAGWGMQFGSPVFLVCLTTLVTLVALNLFGVFEVTLGGRALDTAGKLAGKSGASGAFFNGVLTTVLATPCTAPFLSGALGFAFSQPPAIIVLIFLTVGLGLSAPYLLLTWNPAWLKFLPRPGAWMEKFKIAMGFPMLATVVWLFSVAASSYGKNVLWLEIFLVIVALAAWIFGEFFQRGRSGKTAAAMITLLLLVGGYVLALEKQLHWRAPVSETIRTGSLKESADGIDWQPWSPAAVAAARAAGKIVFVDFTADWCLTCVFNKKTSIEIASVREKIKSLDAVALLADYTQFPPGITAELSRFNRPSVPLVLVYPKNSAAPPLVLPELLTPGLVLDALEQAGKM